MHRDQFNFLDDWLAAPNRKPLIVRGARQVGKSTLVRLFSERCGSRLAEVNLERHPDLGPAFARNVGRKEKYANFSKEDKALAVRFDAAPPSMQRISTRAQRGGTQVELDYSLVSLPLYLVERLPAIVADVS